MNAPSQSNNPLTNPAANAAARANLFATALRETYTNAPTTGLDGAANRVARIKLQPYGILTSLWLVVSMTVTNNAASGGAALAPSLGFPFNLLKNIATQFTGDIQQRVNCDGYELWHRNSIIAGRLESAGNSYAQGGVNPSYAYPTNATTGAIAAATSATVQFMIKVPVAPIDMTTKGSVVMQSQAGDSYLNVTLAANDATGAYNKPFTGNYSITAGSIQVIQNFLMPQGPQAPLPLADFTWTYELAGSQSTQGTFAVGQPTLINFPPARNVHGWYGRFENGAYNYGSDLDSLKIIASGNTYLDDRPPLLWIMNQRELGGGDLGAGLYFSSSARVPINSPLIGAIQLRVVPSSLGTTPSMVSMFESFYVNGQPLPGVTVG